MFRNNVIHNERGDGSFTVLMTSLSIIMLAFFILLNSIAVVDSERKRKALGSLLGAFHILPGGYIAAKGKGRELSLPSIPVVDSGIFFNSVLNRFEEDVDKEGFGEDIGVIGSRKGLTITLSSRVMFESGSADIKETGRRLLKKVAGLIRRVPNLVQVEGHTDSVPINTSKYPSNWELSIDRAANALRYFIEEDGIDPERFSLGGYADSKPLLSDPEYAAKNRRIEITLLNRR